MSTGEENFMYEGSLSPFQSARHEFEEASDGVSASRSRSSCDETADRAVNIREDTKYQNATVRPLFMIVRQIKEEPEEEIIVERTEQLLSRKRRETAVPKQLVENKKHPGLPNFQDSLYDYDQVLAFISKVQPKETSKNRKTAKSGKCNRSGSNKKLNSKTTYGIDDFVIQTKSTKNFLEPTRGALNGIPIPNFKETKWDGVDAIDEGNPDFEDEHLKLELKEKEYRFSMSRKSKK